MEQKCGWILSSKISLALVKLVGVEELIAPFSEIKNCGVVPSF